MVPGDARKEETTGYRAKLHRDPITTAILGRRRTRNTIVFISFHPGKTRLRALITGTSVNAHRRFGDGVAPPPRYNAVGYHR